MPNAEQTNHLYEFGPFRLDVAERLLQREGEAIALKAKTFDMLVLLVQNTGHLLEKEWLLNQLWPDSFVEEVNLNVNISALRKALGESPTRPQFIETVPRRGYRFIAKVTETVTGEVAPAAALDNPAEADTRPNLSADRAPVAPPSAYLTSPLRETAPHIVEQSQMLAPPVTAKPADKNSQPLARFASRPGAVAVALILAMGISAVLFWRAKSDHSGSGIKGIRTIAVLPFQTVTGNEADTAMGLGMADALITRMGSIGQLTVRPTSAVLKYSTNDRDPIEAGKALNVDAVLTGFVQKDGKNIRISTQMIRVADGTTLWADKFDDFFTNVFAVQDSISEKMIAALALHLTTDEQQRLTKRYTENTEAYQLYIQGQYYHHKLIVIKAMTYYEAAISKDPDYALPYSALVGVYLGMSNMNNRQTYLDKARDAAYKAIQLDSNLSEAHEGLGDYKAAVEWDFAGAEQAYQQAVELNPRNASAHYSYGVLLSQLGRPDAAIREMELARQNDPASAYIHADYVSVLVNARRYDEAFAQLQKARELDPNLLVLPHRAARVYAAKSMFAEALAELQQDADRNHRMMFPYAAYVYARMGNRAAAEKLIRAYLVDTERAVSMFRYGALVCAAFNEKDQAFDQLEKAFKARDTSLINLKAEPEWDSLRDDPRFADLLKRMGLS